MSSKVTNEILTVLGGGTSSSSGSSPDSSSSSSKKKKKKRSTTDEILDALSGKSTYTPPAENTTPVTEIKKPGTGIRLAGDDGTKEKPEASEPLSETLLSYLKQREQLVANKKTATDKRSQYAINQGIAEYDKLIADQQAKEAQEAADAQKKTIPEFFLDPLAANPSGTAIPNSYITPLATPESINIPSDPGKLAPYQIPDVQAELIKDKEEAEQTKAGEAAKRKVDPQTVIGIQQQLTDIAKQISDLEIGSSMISSAGGDTSENETEKEALEAKQAYLNGELARYQSLLQPEYESITQQITDLANQIVNAEGLSNAEIFDLYGSVVALTTQRNTLKEALGITDDTPIEWEGRADLIKRYNQLNQIDYLDDLDAQAEAAEIKKKLEYGDALAGNGARYYSPTDKISGVAGGTAKNIWSNLVNAGATMLAAGKPELTLGEQIAAELGTVNPEERLEQKEAQVSDIYQKMWDSADAIGADAREELEKAKRDMSEVGKVGVDIAENVLEMGFDLGTAALTQGSSLVPMFFRVFGGSTQEARQAGLSVDEQLGYGLTKAAIEVATEKMFDGVAHVYGSGAADDLTEALIGKLSSSNTGRTFLRLFIGAGGEGLEEVAADVLSNVMAKISSDETLKELYEQDPADTVYGALIGFIVGGFGGATNIATGGNAQANYELLLRDAGLNVEGQVDSAWAALTGNTEAEQAIDEKQRATRMKLGLDPETGLPLSVADAETATPIATPAVTPTEPATPASPVSNALVETIQSGINEETGKVTNKVVESILADPEQKATFEKAAGVEIKGTKAEQRAIVKNNADAVVAALTGETVTETAAKASATPAEATAAESLAESAASEAKASMYSPPPTDIGAETGSGTDTWNALFGTEEEAGNPSAATPIPADATVVDTDGERLTRAQFLVKHALTAQEATPDEMFDALYRQQNIDNAAAEGYTDINKNAGNTGVDISGTEAESPAAAIAGVGGEAGEGITSVSGTNDTVGSAEGSNGGADSVHTGTRVVIPQEILTTLDSKLRSREGKKGNQGIVNVGLQDSTDSAFYSSSLDAARAADPKYGNYVSPKDSASVQAILDKGGMVLISPDGTAGLIVTPDGDIVAAFRNQQTGKPGSLPEMLVTAIYNGGTKLDCYGIGLVNQYTQAGFVPVARVLFDERYSELTPEQVAEYRRMFNGHDPDVYVMMHNGDSALTVAKNYGDYYDTLLPEDLDSLPTFSGDEGYEQALAYRDSLLAKSTPTDVKTSPTVEESTTPAESHIISEVDWAEQDISDNDSSYIQFDESTHTPDETKTFRDYISSADTSIKTFIQKVLGLKDPKYRNSIRHDISEVSSRENEMLSSLTKANYDGYGNILTGSAVDHIKNRHGFKGKADKSMSNMNDIARVNYVLENADGVGYLLNDDGSAQVSDVWKNSDGTPAQRVVFYKELDGTYYACVAAPDSNAKVIAVESVFIGNNSNRANIGTVLNLADNSAQQVTSETPQRASVSSTGEAVASTENISQSSEKSNSNPVMKRSVTESHTLQTLAEEHGGEQSALYYPTITEAQTMSTAAARVNQDISGEMVKLTEKEAWDATDVDTAMKIYGYLQVDAVKNHDFSAAQAFAKVIQSRGTTTAQALQAFSKWTRTGAAVKDIATREMADNTNLTQNQKDDILSAVYNFADRFDKLTSVDADGNTTVDEAGLRQLILDLNTHRNTGTFFAKNFAKTLDKVTDTDWLQEFALRQLMAIPSDSTNKPSLAKQLKTWQVNSQLLRLTTFGRNIGGNATFGTQDMFAQNAFGVALDWLVSKGTGVREVGFDKGWLSSKVREAAADSLNKSVLEVAADVDMTGEATRYGNTSSRTNKMSGSAFERVMSRWEQILSYSLTSSDRYFRGGIEQAISDSLMAANEGLTNVTNHVADQVIHDAELSEAYSALAGEDITGKNGRATVKATAADVITALTAAVEEGTATDVQKTLLETLEQDKMTQEKADALAKETASYRLFQNESGAVKFSRGIHDAANALLGIRSESGESFGLGDLINPYPGVPANLGVKALEYSPANIVKGGIEIAKLLSDHAHGIDVKSGAQQQAVMDVARGITGTMVVALFASLFKTGAFKNADDEDDLDAKAQKKAEGQSGVQLNLDAMMRLLKGESGEWRDGDTLMSVSWLEPLNAFLSIASLVADTDEDATLGSVLKSYPKNHFIGALQSIMDMPVMSNIKSIFDTIENSQAEDLSGKIGEAGMEFLGNGISGMIPAPVSQLAKAMDDTQRSTQGDTKAETVFNGILANIPWARETLDPKLDAYGNEITYAGTDLERWLNNFVLPGAVTEMQQTDLQKLTDELYEATGDESVIPDRKAPKSLKFGSESVKLTTEQQDAYQKKTGETIESLVERTIHTSVWNGLTDEEKAAALKDIYSYAEWQAKKAFADENGYKMSDSEYAKYEALDDPAEGIIWDNKLAATKTDGEYTDFAGIDAIIKNMDHMSDDVIEMMKSHPYVEKLAEASGLGIGSESFFSTHDMLSGLKKADATLKESGEDTRDYAAIDQDIWKYGITVGDDEEKRAIFSSYYYRADDLYDAAQAGMDSKTWYSFYDEYQRIDSMETNEDGKYLSSTDKRNMFYETIDSSDLSAEHKALLKDQFTFTTTKKIEDTAYDKAVKGGMNPDVALDYALKWSSLEPKEGTSSVTSDQKAEVIWNDKNYTPAERVKLLDQSGIVPTQKAFARWLYSSGLSDSEKRAAWKAIGAKNKPKPWTKSYAEALKTAWN